MHFTPETFSSGHVFTIFMFHHKLMPFNSGWYLSIGQMSNVTTLHATVKLMALTFFFCWSSCSAEVISTTEVEGKEAIMFLKWVTKLEATNSLSFALSSWTLSSNNVEYVTQLSLAKNFTHTRSYASLPRVITCMAFLSKYSEAAVMILFCKCRNWGTEVKWTKSCGKSAFVSLPQTSNSVSMLTLWSKFIPCLSECRMYAYPWMSSHTFTKLSWC